jgi:REP-associated tyrosine transposase
MPWNKPYHPSVNQRLDRELYTCAHSVYFITIWAYQNQSPFLREDLRQLIIDVLSEEQERQNCAIFTYCLMPDHFHFLTSPRVDGISILKFVDQYKGKSTNRSWKVGWQGRLWQPRFFDHVIREDEGLLTISEYILNNPLRNGLVEQPEDWPWGGYMNPLPP